MHLGCRQVLFLHPLLLVHRPPGLYQATCWPFLLQHPSSRCRCCLHSPCSPWDGTTRARAQRRLAGVSDAKEPTSGSRGQGAASPPARQLAIIQGSAETEQHRGREAVGMASSWFGVGNEPSAQHREQGSTAAGVGWCPVSRLWQGRRQGVGWP